MLVCSTILALSKGTAGRRVRALVGRGLVNPQKTLWRWYVGTEVLGPRRTGGHFFSVLHRIESASSCGKEGGEEELHYIRKVVEVRRVELLTSCLQSRRSSQLSYTPRFILVIRSS